MQTSDKIKATSTAVKLRRTPISSRVNPLSSRGNALDKNGAAQALAAAETTEGDIVKWISANIYKRECNKFISTEKTLGKKAPICQCGYQKAWHSEEACGNHDPAEREWKVSKHTAAYKTDAFGELEYVGYGQKVIKYVRVDHMTDVDKMLDLLMRRWQLRTPTLLISVTGGAKNFTMKPRLKEVFRRGLMKAADSTGAWIITGGMNAGVMKHVGEAVRDHQVAYGNKNPIIAIGIAPWGCVNNKELLIDPQGKGLWPAEYRVREDVAVRRQSPLDPNHSHFIMVDNGTQHQFATEINFRTNLESRIARMKTSGIEESAVSIPIVCVVLEGGPGTLETVKSAIQNGTPAVIVEGSGRAADVLAYAYANSSEEEVEVNDKLGRKHRRVISVFDSDLWQKVRKKIVDEWKTDKDIDSRVAWVQECLERRDHMTVFRLEGANSDKDIDLAILQALLKVNRDARLDQLKLALAWNRIDVAKSEIFTDDAKWNPGELDNIMFTAILEDRSDFIELFLDNGVSLKDFLTIDRILKLYNKCPTNSLLHALLMKKKDKKKKYFSLRDVGNVITDLTGDYFHDLYLRDKRYDVDPDVELAQWHTQHDSRGSMEGDQDMADFQADYGAADMGPNGKKPGGAEGGAGDGGLLFEEPARELFIWAVLMHRLDLAMLFWNEGKEGVAAALTAQKLTKSLCHSTDDSELEKLLGLQTQHFEDLALGVLSECYAADERKARQLLVREMNNFGRTTNVVLAVEADNKRFIAHAACQSLLNNIWMGNMQPDTGVLKMCACLFFPFLIWPLIRFTSSTHDLGDSHDRDTTPTKSGENSTSLDSRPTTSYKRARTPGLERGDEEASPPPIPWYLKIGYFYNAPVVTFIFNCISYMVFLCLYSYVMLVSFRPPLTTEEIVLIVWVFTLLVEEIRQVAADESSNLRLKFRSYITDVWNVLDLAAITMYLSGLILRFIPDNVACFTAARVILSLTLMTFFFRILHMFSVHKELGPKLVMIGRMMVDLTFFVVILMVFVSAYGVATQVILYPNTPLNINLVRDVLKKAYFQIFGELFLDEIEGDLVCSSDPLVYQNGTLPRCPQEEATWIVPILLGIYILITNVLMLNLLIAMFSYTFAAIQADTSNVWKTQRYDVVKEYWSRTPIAPPLIVFSHIYLFVRLILRGCHVVGCESVPSTTGFKLRFNDTDEKQLVLWENMNADEYLRRTEGEERQTLENRVKDTNDRVDLIAVKVDEIAEASLLMHTGGPGTSSVQAPGTSPPKLPAVLDDRLTYIEEQLQRTSRALNWIMDSMVDKGMSKGGRPNLPDVDTLRERARQKKDEETRAKKREFEDNLRRLLELHVKSRNSRYPTHDPQQLIHRVAVPDDKVPWAVDWPSYEPVDFTDAKILSQPSYADVDLQIYCVAERPQLPFNSPDPVCRISRVSHCGHYEVKDKLPLNPMGRTGLSGRGVLGRWGPNQAGDPVVTRWKRTPKGEVEQDGGRPVLEFVSIQRADNKEWAIPGGILEAGVAVHEHLKAEFTQEALGTLMEDESRRMEIQKKLDELWSEGEEVYRGYVDDPRNTDNAWLETVAVNFHDQDGGLLNHFQLRAGDTAEMARWQRVTSRHSLYGTHLNILQRVAEKHKAAF